MRRRAAGAVLAGIAVVLPAIAHAAGGPPVVKSKTRWQFTVDDGLNWSNRPPIVRGGQQAVIGARATFDVPDPKASAWWELAHALPPRTKMALKLNGKDVPVPLKGMHYKVIPAVPSSALRPGLNELTARIEIDNREPRRVGAKTMLVDHVLPLPRALPTLSGQTLRFQTGPILGAFGEDFFTVTCRTNMPATVTLTVTETGWVSNWQPAAPRVSTHTSGAGLFHRFRVGKHAMADKLTYQLRATSGEQSAETKARAITLPVFGMKGRDKGQLRFAVTGDSRSRTDDWAAVAAAVLKARPDLFVFTGDMNDHGTNDWEWDEHYLGPESARELLATVPYLPVKGNHEENAPLIPELFHTPGADGKAENWAVEVGSALLIGINGAWSAEWGRTAKWLDRTMAESKAKFIFLTTHYPGWSSAGNGKLDARGRPTHWGYRNVRGTVVPLLRKHKACAYLAAHEHHYERSDLPGGLYQIIAAGAGAPRSSKVPEAARQNPYAKVFVEGLNFCIFEVEGDACTMKALSPDGKVLDTLTWRARKPD